MRSACEGMIHLARAAGARVIVAGSDATDAPDCYLEMGADAVLLGEGLATLMALVDRLDGDSRLLQSDLVAGLPGVVSRVGESLDHPEPAAPLPVPALPGRPAWDLVDIEAYRTVWRTAHGYFSLNMAASRGCSFRCNWCAKPIWGDRYLQRDAREVANEMLYLRAQFGVEHIWFADDIFGFRADWVDRFADALASASGGMPFTIQLRADLVTWRMAAALERASCKEVWIGAESGSQRILDAMNKGTTIVGIEAARRRLGEHGIRVGFFLMLGYLGETFR
jgi:anaerobic magnesium-protoporphyrin IX monomethyl ester cyclase